MVQYCCVPGCQSKSFMPGVRFHYFPSCLKLRKQWEISIRRDKPISPHMKVCSEHFKDSDYFRLPNAIRHSLKRDAVPSVCLPTSRKRSILLPSTVQPILSAPEPRRELQPITSSSSIPQVMGPQFIVVPPAPIYVAGGTHVCTTTGYISRCTPLVTYQVKNYSNQVLQMHNDQCSEISRTVPEENVGNEIQRENYNYLINEDQSTEECLDFSKTVSGVEVKVEIQEDTDSFIINDDLSIEDFSDSSMDIPEENGSIQIKEEVNSDLVTKDQCIKKCWDVKTAASKENENIERNKEHEERVKKLEEELAAAKTENSTLHSLVAELTTELRKYKAKNVSTALS